MGMRAKIVGGDLVLNVYDAIEHLSPEDKRHMASVLACEDSIISDVAAQIVDGFTEDGSWGFSVRGEPLPPRPIDLARRLIAERSSDVAKREIEDLKRSVQRAREGERRHSEWAWRMYHAWPQDHWRERPEISTEPATGKPASEGK